MKLTRRGFIFASTGAFLLGILGIPKKAPTNSQPEPLPQGEYSAIVLDIETRHDSTALITYQVQLVGHGDKWFPMTLEKSHE